MVRKLGKQRAASLQLRLNELRAAEDLQDLLFFPGKWEELKGDRRGQWSGRLTANWRLIVEPVLGTITVILVRDHRLSLRGDNMTALPNYAVSPGEHIREWLSDHDVNAAELARRLNVTPKHVSELLSGKAPLSADVALGLERVTGIPARIWNRFESGYREALARINESSRLASQYEHAQKFPLSYLRKWGFISSPARDRAGTVLELLRILGIADLDAFDATWVHGKVAYRRAKLTTDKAYERAIWLALGEQKADLSGLSPYSSDSLNALIPQLRSLTADPNPVQAITRAAELLQTAGIALCLIPPIPGFGVDGATRWISGHPIIQLSVRGKKDDQLWFTLFHELGHVLLHPHNVVFLNGDSDEDEDAADRFAASILVPEQYRDRLPRNRSIAAVRELAADLASIFHDGPV